MMSLRETGKDARLFRPSHLQVWLAVLLLAVVLLAGYFLPLRYDASVADATAINQPPSSEHWFGTDKVGGDVFAIVIRAAATDLPLALIGTAIAAIMGIAGGLAAGWARKWGEAAMRVLDAFQALPLLVLVLAVVAIGGDHAALIVLAIVLFGAPSFVRVVRSQVLAIREARYVEAARAAGATGTQVMTRHLLPNTMDVLLAQMSIIAGSSLLAISSLSFLGVGIQPPTPSWGRMVAFGTENLDDWWGFAFPGLAIFLCVFALNFIGDSIRKIDKMAGRS